MIFIIIGSMFIGFISSFIGLPIIERNDTMARINFKNMFIVGVLTLCYVSCIL